MSLTLAFDVGYLPSLSELDSTSADPFNRGYCWLLLFDVEEWGTILSKGGYSPLMSVSALRLLAQDYQLTSERLLIKRTSGNFYHITRVVAGTPAYMCVSAQNALSIKPVPGNGPFFEEVVFGGRYINWDRVSLPRMSSPWYDVSAFAQMIRVAFSEPFDKQAHRESIDAQLNVVSVRGVVGPTQRFRASGVFINSASGSWSRYMQQLRMAANYKDRAKDQKVKQPSTRGSRDDDREPRRTETEYDYSDALVSFGKATGTMMRDMYSGIGVYDRETFELHFGLKWIYDVGEEDDTEHPVWKHFSLTVHVCSLMPWFISSVMQDLHDKLETKNPMLAIDRSVIATELAAAMTTEDNSPYMKDRDYYENLQNNGFITPLYGDWSNKIVSLFLVAGFRDPFKDEKVIRELTMSSGDVNDMMTNFSHVLRRINTQLGSCDGVWTPKKWSRAHNMYLRTGTPPGVPPTITWKKVLRQFIEQTEVHQDDVWVSKQVGTETEPTYLPLTDRVLVRDLVNAKDNSFTGVGFYLYVDVVEEGVNRKIKGCFAFEFDVLKYALKFLKFLHPASGESDGFDDDPDDDDGKDEEETQLTMSQTDRTNMLAAMAAVSGGDTVGSRSVSPSGSQRDSDNDVQDIGVPLVKPTNLNEQVWDFMSVEERRKFLKFIKRNQKATGKAKRNNFRLAVGLRLKSDGFVDDENELQEFLSDREKFRQKHSSTSSSV